MSKETMVTEREAVERERMAFRIGWMRECSFDDAFQQDTSAALRAAERRYPLPMVTQPRVVDDNSGESGLVQWRIVDGKLQHRFAGAVGWVVPTEGMFINVFRVQLIADLLANPTEIVEAV